MTEYNYVNDDGRNKKLIVEKKAEGEYYVSIWSRDTGDFCGAGEMTQEKLDAFLQHYGIQG